jgi:hypothetical protein
MSERAEIRAKQKPRQWHIPIYILFFTALFGMIDYYYLTKFAIVPNIKSIWWFGIILPSMLGSSITLFAGGHKFGKRVILAVIGGIITAVLYTGISWYFKFEESIIFEFVWRFFIFTVFSAIGALITELKLGDPKYSQL